MFRWLWLFIGSMHFDAISSQMIKRANLSVLCYITDDKSNSNENQIKIEAGINPYPTAFPYGNGIDLHFYQQQESSTTKTVHKVINKTLKTYV